MTDCYDRASASGAYALGALPPEETAEFEVALRDSEELRAEVESFAETAALLALAAPPVEPSPALKASVLAAIDAQSRVRGLPEGLHVARRPHRLGARIRAVRALVASAAAVALFAAGALAGGLLTLVSDERTADRFAALNAAPDAVRTVTRLPEGGRISFVGSARLGMSAVVLHDAELPGSRVFQAWYVEDGEPDSAGTVEPRDGSVYRMLEGHWDGDPVAMTIEPDGGSEEPTTAPMVLWDGDS